MSFARELQRHQKRLDYTDEQMAEALSVGESTYRAWRNGDPKRVPLPVAREGALARLAKIIAAVTRPQNAEVSQDAGRKEKNESNKS